MPKHGSQPVKVKKGPLVTNINKEAGKKPKKQKKRGSSILQRAAEAVSSGFPYIGQTQLNKK
jgi:hypothetical protein